MVIDPQRDVDIYFQKAKELGVEIKHVLLTHFHADFISGHLEIRKRSGAEICLGVGAGVVEYEHTGLADGDSIAFGDVRIVAMETPGHTPESVCYLLYESAAEPTVPSAVFTGDTLFVGDVGRPDLLASIGVTADELATMLYHSLHDKLCEAPGVMWRHWILSGYARKLGMMVGGSAGGNVHAAIEHVRTTAYVPPLHRSLLTPLLYPRRAAFFLQPSRSTMMWTGTKHDQKHGFPYLRV